LIVITLIYLKKGTLYDNIAGVPAKVYLHLRDYFQNHLISGGRNIELVLLGVAGMKAENVFLFIYIVFALFFLKK
jgi:hypothetical protein